MEKRLSFEREKNGKQTADGRRISTQELVLGGVFTTLIAVGAFIKIPVPVVPFTLQFLFTMLAGLLLQSLEFQWDLQNVMGNLLDMSTKT